jgi:hypothetical protein
VPRELGEKINKSLLRSVSYASFAQQKWSVSSSYCNVRWKRILYDNQRRSAQCLDKDEAPKHFPKLKMHKKKVTVTLWWSAAWLIHHNFLNPGETITAE